MRPIKWQLFTALFLLLVCVNCKNKPQQNQLDDTIDEFAEVVDKPNILLAIADDMSWIHTSFTGYEEINTPNIDYIAQNGVWFNNAYCSAPRCTASGGALRTGRHGLWTGRKTLCGCCMAGRCYRIGAGWSNDQTDSNGRIGAHQRCFRAAGFK